MKLKLIFLMLITVSQGFAQSASDILDAYSQEFAKPQYMAYATKYVLYKGKDSNQILETYNGVFRKNRKNSVYIKVQNNELISNNEMCITISNGERAIFVENPRPYSSGEFDVRQLLPYFKLAPLAVEGGLYKVSMLSTPASGLPYNKIEVFINKKYQLVRQVFYFSTSHNVGSATNPEFVNPRLVIENSDYKYDPVAESIFSSGTYVSGKGSSMTAKLKQYKVYDKRVTQ